MRRKKPKNLHDKILLELAVLKEEIRNDITGPIVASFGFIIALIWRDAIQSAIKEFLNRAGLSKDAYLYQFVSAIIVTIIVMGIMILVINISRKKRDEKLKNLRKKLS